MSASILVVDDETSVREVLCRQLQAQGWVARQADTGRTALQSMEGELPDLLLLDLAMPEMDGIEVMREMRRRGWSVPVVAISGVAGSDLMLRTARLLGARTVLEKPFDTARLLAAVREALAAAGGLPRDPAAGQ